MLYVVSGVRPVNRTEWTNLWPIDSTFYILNGDLLYLVVTIVPLSFSVNVKV